MSDMDRRGPDEIPPWDQLLIQRQDPRGLTAIARERRLVLEDRQGPHWVDLCWVDEVALSLVDQALSAGTGVDLVYPAPAGQVSVLLAAEILLHQFLERVPSPSLGLVTADTTMAARTWEALRISTVGTREPLSTVFPCYRASPDGTSPWGGRRLQGLIIGQRCSDWPVAQLVVDRIAGPIRVSGAAPAIEIYSDPLDPALRRAEDSGRPIWGWSEEDLSRWDEALEVRHEYTVSFSVASERIATMARPGTVTITVAHHTAAEAAVARIHEDLRLLRTLEPSRGDRHFERGMSAAWHHLTTLTSLPCTPSRYDRFCGVPPWAARATHMFEREIGAWADTLGGEKAEYGSVLATDLADLRTALDDGNPFLESVKDALKNRQDTLVVTRTRTAARALLECLDADPNGTVAGCLTVLPLGRLHREGTWSHTLMIGEPSPWDWHRLLSGLSPDVEILALGNKSAGLCASGVTALREARRHWGGDSVRGSTWRSLLHTAPPPPPAVVPHQEITVIRVDGAEYVAPPDPFDSFAGLFELNPLDIGGEGPSEGIARRDPGGEWKALVDAVRVHTDLGDVLLEAARHVEVRLGPRIVDRRPDHLEAGDVLLIGRRAGRVGLIEALEEKLSDRPDLFAARLLLDRYHQLLRSCFEASGLTIAGLHRKMTESGCTKTSVAVRSWVTEGGIMAPRDRTDLASLNEVLGLGMSQVEVSELFAGVQRRRAFRRAAGRALAGAARSSTLAGDDSVVDSETGLSVADLRDTVVEATVTGTTPCLAPVPLTLIGRLEVP